MRFAYGPEATPLPGYTIKRAIDRGGFGEVYFGLSDAGKEVALKLLQNNQQVELRGVRQCLNLKHPNLVSLFDIRTDTQGETWVVMEFISGVSLDRVLTQNPKGLPLPDVEFWLTGIAAGVEFLHDPGIVHRDLKPANVFRENDVVKVGDVGLSKLITPSRRSAQTESVGTVYYMAPEVARGKYGCELDVYSLGVMTYELICGRLPFDGESVAEILMKHLTERPDLAPIPVMLRPVIEHALEKDPLQRTPGVARLAAEFQAAMRGETLAPVAARSRFVDVTAVEAAAASSSTAAAFAETYVPAGPAGESDWQVVEPPQQGFWRQMAGEFASNPVLIVGVVVTGMFLLPVLSFGREGFRVSMTGFAPWFVIWGACYWFWRKNRTQPPDRFGRRPRRPRPPRRRAMKMNHGRDARSTAGAILPRPPHLTPFPRPTSRSEPAPRPNPQAEPREPTQPGRESGDRGGPAKFWPQKSPTRPRSNLRIRCGELCASMVWAALWSVGLSSLIVIAHRYFERIQFAHEIFAGPDQGTFFTLSTILGAWAILSATKLSEAWGAGAAGRWVLGLPLSLAAGWSAWELQEILLVALPADSLFPGVIDHTGILSSTSESGSITASGFMAFFGLLLGLVAWRPLATVGRRRRLDVPTVFLTALCGWMLPILVRFNQPWGACWGAAIAVVVQLSAPWKPSARRPAITPVPINSVLAS